jgi:hypothetical protein
MMAPRRRTDLVVSDLNRGAETVFFDEKNGRVVSVNVTAAAVWYLCDGRRTVSDIARELASAFPALPISSVEQDVQQVIEALTKQELLGG